VILRSVCVSFAFISSGIEWEGRSLGGSVSIGTRLRTGRPGFDSQRRLGTSLFITAFRQALGPTKSPIQWVPGGGGLSSRDHQTPKLLHGGVVN
jgi:hypothetical protein